LAEAAERLYIALYLDENVDERLADFARMAEHWRAREIEHWGIFLTREVEFRACCDES